MKSKVKNKFGDSYIVKNFPQYNRREKVMVFTPEMIWAEGLVVGAWYPKKGDSWSEMEEVSHMGYLGSNPRKPFPQILIRIKTGESKGKLILINGEESHEIKK